MDQLLFRQICDRIRNNEIRQSGIGTLGEKTLHAILKSYFEPSESFHEIRVGNFVADIADENGITEIQTRQFNKLRKKLDYFLSITNVTVVYPVAAEKWILWIDEQTGETTKRRKSPKQGRPFEILHELYKIKSYLCCPSLRFCIVMLKVEEFRLLNGWSSDKKKGSTRFDCIPTELVDEVRITDPKDYEKLIPENLNERFTSKDFKKMSGLSLSRSQTALNVLYSVGAVKRVGRQGNLYFYERAQHPGQDVLDSPDCFGS